MIKAAFFDIDGTLVSFETHTIPLSTINALSLAKANGLKLYISTGRPYALINNITPIRHLIDGYITTNGAYSFIGNTVISCNPISYENVTKLLGCADGMGFACMVVGTTKLTMYNPNDTAYAIFNDMLAVNNLGSDTYIAEVLKQPILQLTPVITAEQETIIAQRLNGVEISRWCPEFADITAHGVSKAIGLHKIAHHNGFGLENTIAFGDGGNDLTMINAAGIGVAMGNANDILKQSADYITSSVEQDGIAKALIHFGVI